MANGDYNRNQPRVTNRQIAYIWTLAKQHGHNADAVRAMTPTGSLSRMSIGEASVLIEALKANRSPDYSRNSQTGATPAQPYNERRPKRLPKGVIRFATEEQVNTCMDLCKQIREEYGWTLEEEAMFWSKRHYSHGGPMNIVRTSTDCVEKIEVAKGILQRIWKAKLNKQRSAQHVVAATG